MLVKEHQFEQLQENNSVQLQGIDYVEFYVGNARQAAHFYQTSFGFTPIAYAGLETGVRDRCSFILEQGEIRFIVTSALTPDSSISRLAKLHGDGVHDVALRVNDIKAAFNTVVERGAKPVLEPTFAKSSAEYPVKATIAGYEGDIVHSFIERHDDANFPLQYRSLPTTKTSTTTGLIEIDHIVFNVELGKMKQWANFYQTVMGFHQTQQFTSDDISTKYSALMSKVLQSNSSRIKFPINEPAEGYRKSQIQEYLDFYHGPGVQHIALKTNDIIATVRQLKSNGVEFLETPDVYYDSLSSRVGSLDEDIEMLRALNILVDRDEEGYLLQIFTKPLVDRPTFFIEIIQRKGSQGFGNGNFKALFEAIELEQASRGNL
jgi:4-hydroxyphenylpyruvate dioxygenase